MSVPFILAHGALGIWDDLIFLGIIVIFAGLMFVSWFRSRNMDFDEADLMPKATPPADDDGDERFQLE